MILPRASIYLNPALDRRLSWRVKSHLAVGSGGLQTVGVHHGLSLTQLLMLLRVLGRIAIAAGRRCTGNVVDHDQLHARKLRLHESSMPLQAFVAARRALSFPYEVLSSATS